MCDRTSLPDLAGQVLLNKNHLVELRHCAKSQSNTHRRSLRYSSSSPRIPGYIRTAVWSESARARTEPLTQTHLFQTIHNKAMGLHDRAHLSRQRAQQLPSIVIVIGECSNKVDIWVWIRFMFFETEMNHKYRNGRWGLILRRDRYKKVSVSYTHRLEHNFFLKNDFLGPLLLSLREIRSTVNSNFRCTLISRILSTPG